MQELVEEDVMRSIKLHDQRMLTSSSSMASSADQRRGAQNPHDTISLPTKMVKGTEPQSVNPNVKVIFGIAGCAAGRPHAVLTSETQGFGEDETSVASCAPSVGDPQVSVRPADDDESMSDAVALNMCAASTQSESSQSVVTDNGQATL